MALPLAATQLVQAAAHAYALPVVALVQPAAIQAAQAQPVPTAVAASAVEVAPVAAVAASVAVAPAVEVVGLVLDDYH